MLPFPLENRIVMKRVVTLFIALLTLLTVMAAQARKKTPTGGVPDFAYPEKVLATAQKDLTAALKSGNGEATVNALVRYGLAKSAVSADSLKSVIARIDGIRLSSTDPAVKSMLALIEADIYNDIYQNDSFVIDRRSTVAGLAGDDYNLWSKQQFEAKIRTLLSDALSDRDALMAIPLGAYKSVIDYSRQSLTFYPTLYDFAAYRAINTLQNFAPREDVLNRRLLTLPLDRNLYPSAAKSVDGEILRLFNSLIVGREETAPGIIALRNMISYILPRVFDNEPYDYLRALAQVDFDGTTGKNAYDAYMSAYRNCEKSPYAIELLLPLVNEYSMEGPVRKEIYAILADFADKNSGYFNINAVKNAISAMTRKTVNLDLPAQAAKGGPFNVTVHSENVNALTLSVYDVTATATRDRNNGYYNGSYYELPATLPAAVKSLKIDIAGEAPFKADTVVEMSLPAYGVYVVVPSFTGAKQKECNYPFVACSDLSAGIIGGVSGMEAFAVNAVTGAPQSGVSLVFRPWSRKESVRNLPGVTGNDGSVVIKESARGNISPVMGKDLYAPWFYYRPYSASDDRKRLRGEIFTDLGLYHPGDRVNFSVVLYNEDGEKRSLATDTEFRVELRDANYQSVDTLNLTTDSWGRAEGSVMLPSEGLTGNFALQILGENNWVGIKTFMVSDYKLPTFFVTADKIRRPAKIGDSASVGGKAVTFAGFPVADATVKLQLQVRSGLWYWASISPVFYETEAMTDADGSFNVVIPADVIMASPCPTGTYMANISVTSADGETHETSAGFNLGKPMTITVNIPGIFKVGSGEKATVEVKDYDGTIQTPELTYTVSKGTGKFHGREEEYKEIKRGTCQPGSVADILSELPSGQYIFTFATVDSALATPESTGYRVIYRADDTESPVNQLLWFPETTLTAGENGEAEVVFATTADDPHVLMVVSDNHSKTIERRWLDVKKGMNRVKLALPAGIENIRAYFSIVSRMKSASTSVNVRSYASTKKLEISTVTFRDKVTPGDLETITFKVKGVNGADAESAVMLDMSNKAIDQLSANPLDFAVSHYSGRYLQLDGWDLGSNYLSITGSRRILDTSIVRSPEFNFYGRSFMPDMNRILTVGAGAAFNSAVRVRGTAPMADGIETVEEVADMGEYKMAASAAVKESADEAIAEEPLYEEESSDAEGTESATKEEVYRPSELPLAFFRPILTTDAEGNLEITYTVPDANTTWVLRSLAYNRELQTASDKVEIMASKPLMVSANAPRFVRCGDKAVLKASVTNAAEETVEVVTVCEILNPVTGERVVSSERRDSIDAKGRAVVDMTFDVPETLQGVVYRVRATAGTFTDGEQVLIPILPSEQNVVESKIFYIAPGRNRFDMEIEPVGTGRAYLNFTENPAWQVVSALPGLRKGEINSSLEAASALFSAAVADGLMKDNPEIARALRAWSENPTDSALVSQLQKNEQLKQILLNSTPWVSDALSQTERMQRLVLLLDRRNTSGVIAKAIDDLKKTFDSDGGWYWTKNYPYVSEWCTSEVLDMLGDLNRMGWLPSDGNLNRMIEKSVKWLDAQTAADFAKYPKSDYSTYCYTRLKFPAVKQSTAAAKVTSATVQRIISDWKEHSVGQKAVDAIILAGNSYGATARSILESLREYATVTEEKGMWWQQLENCWFLSMNKVGVTALILDAFHSADPTCADIDRIRQWLILNKTNNDWGNAVITSQVISSILTSGTKWAVNPAGTAIRIDDTLLTPDKMEYATGAFTRQITDEVKDGATLTIDRQGNYPSFGGVVTMRVLPMDEIKAVDCTELGVEKRMSVFNGAEWVPADKFSVGDRVKVSLVLKADTDMQYVVVTDMRAAGLEPVEQLPAPIWSEGLCFYRENRDDRTNIFIDRMPRGNYILEYELFATVAGTFSSGVASVQSQYNPVVAAHSAGANITIE